VDAKPVIDGADPRHHWKWASGMIAGVATRLLYLVFRRVGAELAIHGGDLVHRWAVMVGQDRRSWRYDCCI
jgi:hypothetical protein